jgi:hypothetical protein
VRLSPEDIDALARRLAELLRPALAVRPAPEARRMMSAAEVAQMWGVERSWVYEHAEELGARRLGFGERPRLRFDPAELGERIAALGAQPAPVRASAPIAADPRRRSLPRRPRGIVVAEDRAAGRRQNAPGPAPKVKLRRADQPSGDRRPRHRSASAPAPPPVPRRRGDRDGA